MIGAALLHLIEGIPEHLIVGLFPVEQKIDDLPYFFILNLSVQIFIYHLCSLFRSDITEQVRTEVPGDRDVVQE